MDSQNSRADFLAGFEFGLKGNAAGYGPAGASFIVGQAFGNAARTELEARRALMVAKATARAWKLYPPELTEPAA